jgi:hypothetical protein
VQQPEIEIIQSKALNQRGIGLGFGRTSSKQQVCVFASVFATVSSKHKIKATISICQLGSRFIERTSLTH